jgi:phosphoenolpyruvate carboxykinase (ATP)
MQRFDLTQYGISGPEVLRNLSPAVLYEEAIRFDDKTYISATGALVAYSGEKTGRSPRDKRAVKQPPSQDDIWWGSVNVPLEPFSFKTNRQRAINYLQTRDRLYVVDGFAGWDPAVRLRIRVICSRPYHALFMHNMLIRATHEELLNFGEPDCVIFNAGAFPANRLTQGMTSTTSVDLSFEDREMVILGTEYAGEMKKGVFTIMNYLMPKRGLLPMHCSATIPGKEVIHGLPEYSKC